MSEEYGPHLTRFGWVLFFACVVVVLLALIGLAHGIVWLTEVLLGLVRSE